MEITITEALRIKNELSQAVKTLNYKVNYASFGVITEDNEVVSQDTDKFEEVESSLIKALNFSEELNGVISSFNKNSRVDDTVRKMQNAKLLLEVYTRNLDKTKPKQNKKFENLGTVRQIIDVVYTPSISAKEMKDKISVQKTIIRELQSSVEKVNQSVISVNFEYSDLESLVN